MATRDMILIPYDHYLHVGVYSMYSMSIESAEIPLVQVAVVYFVRLNT